VRDGAALDQRQYEAAMNDYRSRLQHWNYQIQLAPGVLGLNAEACRTALWYVGAFDEIEGFGSRVTLDAMTRDAATFSCSIEDQEIVPAEEVELTAGASCPPGTWPPASTGRSIKITWRPARSGSRARPTP
jgi:hypothetical protein